MSKKVLAVASGGGHWKQLILIKSAFSDCNVKYVTTIPGLPEQEGISNFELVKDSNQTEKLALLITLCQVFLIVLNYRPDVVISTGAAPGIWAILIGRLFGAKTIWLDSIANAEQLSLGGKISKKIAHTVLTQWEHLADGTKIIYRGSVF
jgi:UDP-N-acetylglucosamine:LPS N-acetylglucosamine transferase